MATFGSLTVVTTTNNSYTGDGSYSVVDYAQPNWQYNISVVSTNVVTVTNNLNGAKDTLTGINEIDFANNPSNLGIYLTPLVTNYTYTGKNYADIYAGPTSQNITILSGDTVWIFSGSTSSTYNIINNGGQYGRIGFGNGKALTVDLQAGTAISPQGAIVSLQNFQDININGNNGDRVYGTTGDDLFWLSFNNKGGSGFVDGRGGNNSAVFWNIPQSSISISNVAPDGSSFTATSNGYTYSLQNIQSLQFNYPNGSQNLTIPVSSFIDFSKVGPQTLLPSLNSGWEGSNYGSPTTITYSFMQSLPLAGEGTLGTGFSSATASYQNAVQSILNQLSQQIGVTFNLVNGSSTGTLQFGSNHVISGLGYSFGPNSGATAGEVWLDSNALNSLQPGQQGYQSLLSGIAQALGLSQPVVSSVLNGQYKLLDQWNNNDYTVMSNNLAINGLFQSWFGPLDISALQALYGVNTNITVPTNQIFAMTDSSGVSISSLGLTNSKGFNILDCSQVSRGVYINLNSNTYSSVGVDGNGVSAINNLFIGPNSLIQEVIGTNDDDYFLGNSLNDVFILKNGNDKVVGGSGLNTVVLNQAFLTYSMYKDTGSGNWIVSDINQTSGFKQLSNVQRLQFTDANLALDLMPYQVGGQAAEILGAVFGKTGITNKVAAGTIISALDSGQSLTNVMSGALNNQLGLNFTNTDEINLLYKNLLGTMPQNNDLIYWNSVLSSGQFNQASLAIMASQSTFNLTNINLVGLQSLGLVYQPQSLY